MMKLRKFLSLIGVLMLIAFTCQPAWASDEFVISCEGTRSTGGGTYEYQYTLKNISGASVTLTEFYIGTQDPNPLNYTFIPTAGFTPSIISNTPPPGNSVGTNGVKTPHQIVPPAPTIASSARVYWSGSVVIPDQATITFAFNHPNAPWDQEWHAGASGLWTISKPWLAMAGPIGVYTLGYAHAPGPEPAQIPTLTSLGMAGLIALLLLVATLVMVRRRRHVLRME